MSANDNVISYSIDNGDNWIDLAADTNTPTVTKGKKVLWRGKMTHGKYVGIGKFTSTGQFEAQGNVMSMLFGDNFKGRTDLTGKNYAFYNLFSSNSNLVNTQNLSLSATTLAEGCYGYMFYGCTNLTTAPELPASTLASSCYHYMFNGCTKLKTAPTLSATTLANYCYEYMFDGCSSLNYIKCLATKPSTRYTRYWIRGVASTGTFVKNSAATWNVTGVDGIPSGWTVVTE